MTNAFGKACDWLEKESELHNVSKFAAKIKEFAERDSYTKKCVTMLFLRKYGDHVIINHAGHGKEIIFLFQTTARFNIKENIRKKR